MSGLKAKDPNGDLYDVTDDHAMVRREGTKEWRPIAEVRMEVGQLYLLPTGGSDG